MKKSTLTTFLFIFFITSFFTIAFSEECDFTFKTGDGVTKLNNAFNCLNKKNKDIESLKNEIVLLQKLLDDLKKEIATSAGSNALSNIRFEFKSIKGLECKEKVLKLGKKSDYLIWALSSQEIYRHGCNKGQTFCKVELNGNEWLLKAQNSSHHCKKECGTTSVECTAIGILK